jgi:hypothetical protein
MLEKKLDWGPQAQMRRWWTFRRAPWLWLKLMVPRKYVLAWKFSWRTRKTVMLLHCCLPLLAVLAVLFVILYFGITGLTTSSGLPSGMVSALVAKLKPQQ